MNPVAGESERPMVLLVEDDADVRAYLREHLDPHYDVLEAARGDDGLEAIRRELPDVIVSDILMPGLDGYALCRAVKSDPEMDFIPLILLTSKADAQSKLEGFMRGADDYLSKPFDPAELLLRIRNRLLAQARLAAHLNTAARVPAADILVGHSATLQPTPLSLPSSDAVFSKQVRETLDRESQHASFNVEVLAAKLRMSRGHLHRRIQDVFGLAPSELLMRFRLERAARMLVERAGTAGEIAYAVGFRDLSHFVRRFRTHYGQTPAKYAAARRQ
jgi:DNA-binding response OmpR family regulator